ncbi:hypothetical protein Y032_0260g508 [Ancylostoma ceylanicum]|uniref:Uncharacterized protein n=1 Tax=Ancylostoma ceylanicum TaxID=53326 RepID=A0A016SB46_9BILA|nr:hypothetical protein Y032_0260g508 [Ancylostoma ceylanicum]
MNKLVIILDLECIAEVTHGFHEISHADYTFSTPVVRSSLSWLKPSPRSMEFLGAWQALFQLTAQQYELLTEASTNIRGGKVVVI